MCMWSASDKLSSTDLKPISEGKNKKYTKLELDYKFDDPTTRKGSITAATITISPAKECRSSFISMAFIRTITGPRIRPDKINYDLLEKRAKLVFYTAWDMANRNDMLKRDIALPTMAR